MNILQEGLNVGSLYLDNLLVTMVIVTEVHTKDHPSLPS